MIGGVSQGNNRASERIEGVKEAMAEVGLPIKEGRFVECVYDIEKAGEAFRRIWNQDTKPTAIICGIDVIAYGALFEAQKMGLRVPEDLSITGFDDLEFSHLVNPPLTTIKVPCYEMGNMAAVKLLEAIEMNRPPQAVRIDAKLMVRKSTARPSDTI